MSDNTGDVYVATQSFVTIVDGERITCHKGKTRVREGHPLHRAAPSLFKPVDVHFDIETTREEPPAPPAPAKKAAPAAKKAAAPASSGDGERDVNDSE